MSQSQYEKMIKNMPPGLDRAILRVLEFHRGRSGSIGGDSLTELLNSTGYLIENRTVREAIKELRRAGHLICAAPGGAGGYYLAETAEEFEDFARHEFEAKISDMAETLAAMRKTARERFGQGVQRSLF